MISAEARYEFRVWGEGLDEAADRLSAASPPAVTRDSVETYLLARPVDTVNAKVRDGVLDVKELVGVGGELEQWTVRLKAEFPIEAGLLRSVLFPLLGVSASLERERYSPDDLLAEVVAPRDDLAAVEVAKRRRGYTVRGCIGEVADVTIAGAPWRTLAVESADPAALGAVCRLLGLKGLANRSYPKVIRGVLGWNTTA